MKTAFALLLFTASTIAVAHEQGDAAAIGQLMQGWQARILAQNLPVDDAKNWSRRNMAKFGRLNTERLGLAQRAATLEELELALVDAPLTDGARLDVLMANKPGNIAVMATHAAAKSSPASSPSSYAGLVFTATTPCRIMDTRPSQGGFGAWAAGSSNLVKIGPYASGYYLGPGAQGGSNTSCGLDALAGPGQIAAVLAAVSTVSQAGAGYLTFYPQGSPNPGLTSVSQWYQTGFVQTSFVLITTDLSGVVAASGFTSAATDVIIDVVGYFAAEGAEGTVTNVATGAGLTGGPITTTGTIGLASTNLLPTVACATNQIPKWSGSAWACAADANSGGTLTGLTVSAPLQTSGGTAPNISFAVAVPVGNGGTGQSSLTANGVLYGQGTSAVATAVGAAGQLLAGTAGAPAWTGSPSISGNLTLLVEPSTSTAGIITKAGTRFIHTAGSGGMTFVGINAGNLSTNASGNTGIGQNALLNTNGNDNTAVGADSLRSNTSGGVNVALGVSAMQSNTTGAANTALGTYALIGNLTGSNNTAVGYAALGSNTAGNNTAVGSNALTNTTNGNINTAIGGSALQDNTTGAGNTAAGFGALMGNTTGGSNAAFGNQSLHTNTAGSGNTGVGTGALGNNTGSNNTSVGVSAGALLTSGNFNIMIGHIGAIAESATIRIGDSNQTRAFIAGIRGVTTAAADAIPVLVSSTGQLGTVSSSRHVKDDIADMDAASSALMKLRPVTFHYKSDSAPSGRTLQYGLIAEEVANVYPGLIAHSANGKIETVMYQFLPPMLLNEVQKQQRTIERQAAELADQRRVIVELQAAIAEIAVRTAR